MEDAINPPVFGAGCSASVFGAGMMGSSEKPPFDSESEEALKLRYGRLRKEPEDLVYEFTRDPALLHQYYLIREKEFKSIYNAPRFSGEETIHDRKGRVLIVRKGNQCIGGVRLSFKTPRTQGPLPLEIKDFRVEHYFPQLKNKEAAYCQASWFSLLTEYHGSDITRKLVERVCAKAASMNMEMLFGVAPILNARVYNQHFKALGFKEAKIHFDIEMPSYPTYEEIKLHLISVVLDKVTLKDTAFSKMNNYDQWEEV